jgi:hypothetical protein
VAFWFAVAIAGVTFRSVGLARVAALGQPSTWLASEGQERRIRAECSENRDGLVQKLELVSALIDTRHRAQTGGAAKVASP